MFLSRLACRRRRRRVVGSHARIDSRARLDQDTTNINRGNNKNGNSGRGWVSLTFFMLKVEGVEGLVVVWVGGRVGFARFATVSPLCSSDRRCEHLTISRPPHFKRSTFPRKQMMTKRKYLSIESFASSTRTRPVLPPGCDRMNARTPSRGTESVAKPDASSPSPACSGRQARPVGTPQ